MIILKKYHKNNFNKPKKRTYNKMILNSNELLPNPNIHDNHKKEFPKFKEQSNTI